MAEFWVKKLTRILSTRLIGLCQWNGRLAYREQLFIGYVHGSVSVGGFAISFRKTFRSFSVAFFHNLRSSVKTFGAFTMPAAIPAARADLNSPFARASAIFGESRFRRRTMYSAPFPFPLARLLCNLGSDELLDPPGNDISSTPGSPANACADFAHATFRATAPRACALSQDLRASCRGQIRQAFSRRRESNLYFG
jgi:hypothetical protein